MPEPNGAGNHPAPAACGSCESGNASKMAGWFVLLAALLVAAGVWKAIQVRNPVPEPLRIGLNPWPGYEFASLAAAKGYFEVEGVDARLLELSSLGDCRRAFERGQVDGFFGTLIEVLESDARLKRNSQVVCVVDYSDGADSIIARKPISSVAELRGKRVAIESGSVNVLV
ncbi:MAG: ABC transporter substrate-binding protein, partial [Planctomycetota bacterium]|nr:ABC transporter substrate-binding protein [Planctomycetota bacterium]